MPGLEHVRVLDNFLQVLQLLLLDPFILPLRITLLLSSHHLSVDAAGGEPGWPWTTAQRHRQGPRAGGGRGWPGLSPAATRTPLISNWEGRVGGETGCWRC